MTERRTSVRLLVALLALSALAAPIAVAKGEKNRSAATISVQWSDDCKEFVADSDKDISHFVIFWTDEDGNQSQKFEEGHGVGTPHVEYGSDQTLTSVTIKSGSTEQNFPCTPCPEGETRNAAGECEPVCPEGEELVNGECVPECPEGQTRNAAGECEPVCPEGEELVNGECVPDFVASSRCRASIVRIHDNPVLTDVLMQPNPFEPFVANDVYTPCADDTPDIVLPVLDIPLGAQGEPPNTLAPGPVSVQLLSHSTSDNTGGAADVRIVNVAIADVAEANVVRSHAEATCQDGTTVLNSESSIVGLTLDDGTKIVIPPDDPNTPADESQIDIPIPGVGTLHVNHETIVGDDISRRAIWFEPEAGSALGAAIGEIVVGEARAGADCS